MKFIIRLLVVFSLLVMSACNIWEGFKKYSSKAGKAIGEAAESAGKSIKEAAE